MYKGERERKDFFSNPQAEMERRGVLIEDIAKEFGLDFFPVHFITIPSDKMHQVGAYGLPGRYSHWTHGKAYERARMQYEYGLSKSYELITNTNPGLGFMLEGNSVTQNTLIIPHVLAHMDFFKNNVSFGPSNRKMDDSSMINADRISRYEYEHGKKEVEKFLDAALAIEFNIDMVDLNRPDSAEYVRKGRKAFLDKVQGKDKQKTPYDDLFAIGEPKKEEKKDVTVPFPPEPEEDLLWFVANFSPKPLEDWQKDVLGIVRQEAQYFLPQMKTKIMNEGWATYWHMRIMRELEDRGELQPGEIVEWARMNAQVLVDSGGHLTPYGLGLKIWEDIDRRFKGEHDGKMKKERTWWGEELDPAARKDADELNIFRVRADTPSDQAFLRNYLSDGLIDELKMAAPVLKSSGVVSVTDPDVVRAYMSYLHNNFGQPSIRVAVGGGDYGGRRDLYLEHRTDDQRELDFRHAAGVLKSIYVLWGRPIHLSTWGMVDGSPKQIVMTCTDGSEVKSEVKN